MSKSFNILLLGATGAVGGEVLKTLLAMPDISRITVLVRRPLPTPLNAKITQYIVDVFDPASYAAHLVNHNIAICTFGVGQPTKVSKDEFIRVDKMAVLDFAKACRAADVKHFELLGSVAADATSRSFYLKTKGELRDAIAALNFERFSTFQPSVILTPANRYGMNQAIMLAVWPVISRALLGSLQKYRGIRVDHLGKAIAVNIQRQRVGQEVLHWPVIRSLATMRLMLDILAAVKRPT
jgi:uncharacterized protein YbjT (DUF2867 family)